MKLLAEEGGCCGVGGDKERVLLAPFVSIPIAIVMSDPTDKSRVHFLELPVEIQLAILRQLIGFQGDHAPIDGTVLLKGIRL